MKKLALLKTACLLLTVNLTFGQAGELNTVFGNNGIVKTAVGDSDDVCFAVAAQPDGKILAAGYTFNGSNYDFAIARYDSTGSLDAGFGNNGIVTTDFGGTDDYAGSIVLQQDQKIVVAGITFDGTRYRIALARYDTDGVADNTFGAAGKMTPIYPDSDDFSGQLIMQPDSKILLSGTAVVSNNTNTCSVMRFNADGTKDSSFGTFGIVSTRFGIGVHGNSIALQTDGNILVGGTENNGGNGDFMIARYLPNGTLDKSFKGGIINTDYGSSDNESTAIVLQHDGKAVLAGFSFSTSTFYNSFSLVRYNTDGSVDTTYGNKGFAITDFGMESKINSAIIQPDEKIIAAGFVGPSSPFSFALIRYNKDGTPDASFGNAGKVITNFGNSDLAESCALAPAGKIVAGGYSDSSGKNVFALAEYIEGPLLGVIDFPAENNSVFVYPNPVKSELSLKYTLTNDQPVSLRLVDMKGKLVQEFFTNVLKRRGEQMETIHLNSSIPAGNYFLQLSSGKQKINLKINKE